MIQPEQFDIVQRSGTKQCRIRIVVRPREHRIDEDTGEEYQAPSLDIWLSPNRYNDPIEGTEHASLTAVAMACDLFGEPFGLQVMVHLQERGLLSKGAALPAVPDTPGTPIAELSPGYLEQLRKIRRERGDAHAKA